MYFDIFTLEQTIYFILPCDELMPKSPFIFIILKVFGNIYLLVFVSNTLCPLIFFYYMFN